MPTTQNTKAKLPEPDALESDNDTNSENWVAFVMWNRYTLGYGIGMYKQTLDIVRARMS